jgi:hypothetical protein
MYATGSRQELEALIHHLEDNHRIALSRVRDGRPLDDTLGVGLLFCSMLRDALNDHFNGKN